MIELARTLAAARSQSDARSALLDAVAERVSFDIAFFHALNPRVPAETAVLRGIDPDSFARTMRSWDRWAVELGRFRDVALANGGVAVDTAVFPASARARLGWYREVARPLGIAACALVHLLVAGRVVAVIGLCRKRGTFDDEELAWLRALAPLAAIADAAHAGVVVAPLADAQRMVCVDDRLTPRQREIVAGVALGHTNAEIARALGASPNTVRNQLAAICRALGAANRAEVVRLAVLR